MFHPLRMLPLVALEILCKLVWLAIVALPLWAAGELTGSSAEEMTVAFALVVLPIVAIAAGRGRADAGGARGARP